MATQPESKYHSIPFRSSQTPVSTSSQLTGVSTPSPVAIATEKDEEIYVNVPGSSSKKSEGREEWKLYEAVYDYEGEAEGDLSFSAGDIIEVGSISRSHVANFYS